MSRALRLVRGHLMVTFLNVDDDAGPALDMVVACRRCQRELGRRSYDTAHDDLATLLMRVNVEAELDALRALAHACGERN